MNQIHPQNLSICSGRCFRKALLPGLLLSFLCLLPVSAEIRIGGDVYGGGVQGNVGTSGQTGDKTTVVVNSGTVRTVFGGGYQGEVYGNTTVTVSGGTVGAGKWEGTPFGGIYGAGDGAAAIVHGNATVEMSAGVVVNNIYGGGKQALLEGNTTLHVTAGQINGSLFGGARMADVNGYAYVNVVGGALRLLIGTVYGGNDISGNVLNQSKGTPDAYTLPLTPAATPNAFVRISGDNGYPVIGSLYGGGNGDYDYTASGGNYTVTLPSVNEPVHEDVTFTVADNAPEMPKTFIDITGGTFGAVYGGGNSATVTTATDIYFCHTSNPATLPTADADLLGLTDYCTVNGTNATFQYHVWSMFGGNNTADMAIRPTWHLTEGTINNLYSGGNKGAMTNPGGILLALQSDNLEVNNVYGGCRMADVRPSKGAPAAETIEGFAFPAGYSARVYLTAGRINNVYGGNDISGKVYHGTNLEIHGAVSGDIYGGGNGFYAYTDQLSWVASHPEDADFYYAPGANTLEALYAHRPHIQKTRVHISGSNTQTVYVTGGVYCGGNSATIDNTDSSAEAELVLGGQVQLNNVFLGSNGAHMADAALLAKYADTNFSTIASTAPLIVVANFDSYMKGVAVNILPSVSKEWADGASPAATQCYVGSFYCGGNVGSMTTSEPIAMTFPKGLTIFEKIVGGCNQSIVEAGTNNARHIGGVTVANMGANVDNPKVTLNVNCSLEPRIQQVNGGTPSLNWHTTTYTDEASTTQTILVGGNVYGGCYNSGIVNGGVTVNVAENLISDAVTTAGYNLTDFGNYPFSNTLTVYGAGYGEKSEVWGTATVNLRDRARVLKAFGGGQMGVVGQLDGSNVTLVGNTQVTVAASACPVETTHYTAYKVYGGGFEGAITGASNLSLLGGRVYDAFGGSCNADIYGYTQVAVGSAGVQGTGYPLVENSVFGANDFGGQIKGAAPHILVAYGTQPQKTVRAQSSVEYIAGKVKNAIFGGACGSYDYSKYTAPDNKPTLLNTVTPQTGEIAANTLVYISSKSTSANDAVVSGIFGGGCGKLKEEHLVDVLSSYVYLNAATNALRTSAVLTPSVFGGGYYSKVTTSQLEAVSGYVSNIFGGTRGDTKGNLGEEIEYSGDNTHVNVYATMDNPQMDIYGGGSYTGADVATHVTLYGGKGRYVFGGSYNEGISVATHVLIPYGSTFVGTALYGGGWGMNDQWPCVVTTSNITYNSATAYFSDAIFGGNKSEWGAVNSNVNIHVPVRVSANGAYNTIYGGGDGANTIAGYTRVTLDKNEYATGSFSYGRVNTIFGGGRDGKVFNNYKRHNYTYEHWSMAAGDENTLITLNPGTQVEANVYGGGYGAGAAVCGNTNVDLLGGTVVGDIYGGGYAGTVEPNTYSAPVMTQDISTHVLVQGGTVRNVFAGGYQGAVNGTTNLTIGTVAGDSFADGKPTILRSAYGGGEYAAVNGASHVTMYNGYVGYRFNGTTYVQNKDVTAGDKVLKDNGNLYGGGLGDGASVNETHVTLYDGVVRNGLYGGGEIGVIGVGRVSADKKSASISTVGTTEVEMYGGLVEGNLFGGGRGFSYDKFGNSYIGALGTDGYVFGRTAVYLYRGTVGTPETLAANSDGNVFGGGNVGFVYTEGSKMGDGYYYKNGELTEDCKVIVSAYGKAKSAVTVNGHAYQAGEYILTSDLDALENIAAEWDFIDDTGVTVLNAVFAGGNITLGSDYFYAQATTIYGNATATVIDTYNKDLTIIGGEGIGGLYGDGNLTLVDGYQELNITNYGTDYYSLAATLTYEEYLALTDRERAYFELQYKCTKACTANGANYTVGSIVKEEVYDHFTAEEKKNFEVVGTCTLYAGRMMNTIQRADFCGIFGCRIVMRGAQDRVPSQVDYTNYTVNRIGEVSLNKKGDHGNYFGIYNVVHFLGALTSDVAFGEVRTTSSSDYPAENNKTFYEYKKDNIKNRNRNNGTSHNKVAIAGGVWLDLLKETSDPDVKEYGPITGVIELDLIKVATGEGGGYVYAKNQHGTPTPSGATHLTLAAANDGAVTQKSYTYAGDDTKMETSGNFVHSLYRIVDNCFPTAGDYNSPAHYWYIKGDFYVYDQMISAYTGAAQAYKEKVEIPLTIAAGASGRLELLSVDDNYYCYLVDTLKSSGDPFTQQDSVMIGTSFYRMNDPISSWDYSRLSVAEKRYFTKMTYVCSETVTVGGETYQAGDVIKPDIYNAFGAATFTNKEGKTVPVKSAFNITNALSRDNGFLLTYDVNNPAVWDDYYTKITDGSKITKKAFGELSNAEQQNYVEGPSFRCTTGGVYGQTAYIQGGLIGQSIFQHQQNLGTAVEGITETQAQFLPAYVCLTTGRIGDNAYVKGSCITNAEYAAMASQYQSRFEPAYLCTNTVKVSDGVYYINGDVITDTEYDALDANVKSYFEVAYLCASAGSYGGKVYQTGHYYTALDFSNLNHTQREFFTYNWDALDLFSTDFNADKNLYRSPYKDVQLIDYTAVYEEPVSSPLSLRCNDGSTFSITAQGQVLTNVQYESLLNEQQNYAIVNVTNLESSDTVHIVNTPCVVGDKSYNAGRVITETEYNLLSSTSENITTHKFTALGAYYICKKDYTTTMAIKDIDGTEYAVDAVVPKGTILVSEATQNAQNTTLYSALANYQKNFRIVGMTPTELSSLYVARETDINDLKGDRIITVVYRYTYTESDATFSSYEDVTERHIVNIRVKFESGVPMIGNLLAPAIVLPGSTVGLNQPTVTKGAYDILGGGWEMYANQSDAESHINGVDYVNRNTPMYWYQNNYYVAYYTKTYLGRTFSNAVPFSVANYHRMERVMTDANHLFVDTISVSRDCKIYIDDHACANASKNELDYFADFYQLTTTSAVGNHIANGENLQFILQTDMGPKAYANWTPVGVDGKCFEGTFHGDGHVLSNMNNSLFGYLCGKVYNLGVMGSFTGGGVADHGGYVRNCWVWTTGTPAAKAVIGDGGEVVNSYYCQDQTFTAGNAIAKPLQAFLNGEVAFNLNSFYLQKRANDTMLTSGKAYSAWTVQPDHSLALTKAYALAGDDLYVENRFQDGDFIYFRGIIPEEDNIRYKVDSLKHFALYPDDYIFFGQNLSYDLLSGAGAHEVHPTVIRKDADGRVELDNILTNRVFRAPAYYLSKNLQRGIYFNACAVFADRFNGTKIDKDLTAIDFTGCNDGWNNYRSGTAYSSNDYLSGMNAKFYPPLLDFEGLTSFNASNLTRNLLVYAGTADAATYTVLKEAMAEPEMVITDADNHNAIAKVTSTPLGHLVDWDGTDYTASTSQFLVDKQNFNCPISYSFATDTYMWYQRTPEVFANGTAGWETLCLPFTADLVTTQQKGELTHFYGNENLRHEYWLRGLTSVANANGNTVTAGFVRPMASGTGADSRYVNSDGDWEVANTFLNDYYYSKDNREDKNEDEYQTYYGASRTYADYIYCSAEVPYLIGFPGSNFYEFDLSGTFVPQHTATTIAQLEKQTLSFVSIKGQAIRVSDDENRTTSVSNSTATYTYTGTYQGATMNGVYVLDATGAAFEQMNGTMVPFRAYFTATGSSPAPQRIGIGGDTGYEEEKFDDVVNRGLTIYAKDGSICIESTQQEEATVLVYSANGQLIKRVIVKPETKEIVPVSSRGIYIANNRKIAIL